MMAKKIEEPDVKKECPSCGLGVSLDSKICEFCGWDFEEEDEWILQIEKLERELMLEKRKFEPGSVEQRIEATLYTPKPSKPSVTKTEEAPEQAPQKPVAARPTPAKQEQRQRAAAAPKQKSTPVAETIEIDDMRVRSVRGGPEPEPSVSAPPEQSDQSAELGGKVRRVRSVKAGATSEGSPGGVGEGKSRKVRVVRKVKQ